MRKGWAFGIVAAAVFGSLGLIGSIFAGVVATRAIQVSSARPLSHGVTGRGEFVVPDASLDAVLEAYAREVPGAKKYLAGLTVESVEGEYLVDLMGNKSTARTLSPTWVQLAHTENGFRALGHELIHVGLWNTKGNPDHNHNAPGGPWGKAEDELEGKLESLAIALLDK